MMTYDAPAGAGAPPMGGAPQGPPQDPMAGGPQGQGGMDPQLDMIMQVAMMVLGHPPQNEQELMQVLQVVASMQGDASMVAGGPAAGAAMTSKMPASNTALVKAVDGGI